MAALLQAGTPTPTPAACGSLSNLAQLEGSPQDGLNNGGTADYAEGLGNAGSSIDYKRGYSFPAPRIIQKSVIYVNSYASGQALGAYTVEYNQNPNLLVDNPGDWVTVASGGGDGVYNSGDGSYAYTANFAPTLAQRWRVHITSLTGTANPFLTIIIDEIQFFGCADLVLTTATPTATDTPTDTATWTNTFTATWTPTATPAAACGSLSNLAQSEGSPQDTMNDGVVEGGPTIGQAGTTVNYTHGYAFPAPRTVQRAEIKAISYASGDPIGAYTIEYNTNPNLFVDNPRDWVTVASGGGDGVPATEGVWLTYTYNASFAPTLAQRWRVRITSLTGRPNPDTQISLAEIKFFGCTPPTPTPTFTPCGTTYLYSEDWEAGSGQLTQWDQTSQSASGTYNVTGSGNKVLSMNPAGLWQGATYNLLNSVNNTDFSVRVSGERGILLACVTGALNYQGAPNNGYSFQVIPNMTNGTVLSRFQYGGWAQLAQASTTGVNSSDFRLRLVVKNGVLTGYVDGTQVISATDSSFAAGRVGVMAYNSTTTYDELRLNPFVGCPPTPTPTPVCPTSYLYSEDWEAGSGQLAQWDQTSQSASGTYNVTGSGNKVLSMDPAGLWQGATYNQLTGVANTDFSARVSGNRGILMARVQGSLSYQGFPNNGYNFQVIPNATNGAIISRFQYGGWTPLTQCTTTGVNSSDFRLRLVVNGSNLQGYVDGTLVLSTFDNTFATGRVGVAAYNATTTYDELRLNPFLACTPTPTPDMGGASARRPDSEPKSAGRSFLSGGKKLLVAPNPAKGSCSIFWRQDSAGEARLRVYNLLGEPVTNLSAGVYDSGEHQVELGLSSLASGLYIVVLETNEGMGWRSRAQTKLAVVR